MGNTATLDTGNAQIDVTNGAVRVTTMPAGGRAHVREIDTFSTTAQTLDFSANPISAIKFVLVPEAAMTIDPHTGVFCVDPPNSTVRDAWLTAGTSLSADTYRYPMIAGQNGEVWGFSAPASYIGVKVDLGASNCRLFAIGVEA